VDNFYLDALACAARARDPAAGCELHGQMADFWEFGSLNLTAVWKRRWAPGGPGTYPQVIHN